MDLFNKSGVRTYLKFSVMDIFVLLTVLISSHAFFVLKERFFSVVLCFVLVIIFQILGRQVFKKFMLMMSLFFASFWLLEIPYPFIGHLFWPIDQFLGALILFLGSKFFIHPKEPLSWSLRFSKRMVLSIVGIVVPSLICLILYFINHREVADKWPLPQMPLWAIPFAVVLIALINGLREEIYFRFTLQRYLTECLSPQLAILCASLVFGYMHYQGGFPAGGLGVFLTTLFGFLIGIQFYYFRSATLSWITHSVTDAVMFAIILLSKT